MKKSYLLLIPILALTLTSCNQKIAPGKQSKSGGLSNLTQKNQSMNCTYEGPNGTTTSYVKGEKSRTENAASGIYGNTINDGEFVYIWDSTSKKGQKYLVPEASEPQESDEDYEAPTQEELAQFNDIMEQMEDFEADCQNENIPDSMFVPPSDITFSDMTQMQQDMENLSEKWEGKEDFDAEDMEELNKTMEQMNEAWGE